MLQMGLSTCIARLGSQTYILGLFNFDTRSGICLGRSKHCQKITKMPSMQLIITYPACINPMQREASHGFNNMVPAWIISSRKCRQSQMLVKVPLPNARYQRVPLLPPARSITFRMGNFLPCTGKNTGTQMMRGMLAMKWRFATWTMLWGNKSCTTIVLATA